MLQRGGWRNGNLNAASKVVSVLPGCLASELTNGNFKGQFDTLARLSVGARGVEKLSPKSYEGEVHSPSRSSGVPAPGCLPDLRKGYAFLNCSPGSESSTL